MRLSVRSIQGERGAQLHSEFCEDVQDIDWDNAVEVVGPVCLQVTATNLGSRIGVEGRLQADVRLMCSRCAQPYVLRLDEQFEEFFVRRDGPVAGERGETRAGGAAAAAERLRSMFEEDDGDRPYSGDVLDLRDVVREHVLLALPMKPVCREDCRGLCPVCGANLNEVSCTCRAEDVDPRLAGLKKFLDERVNGRAP